MGAGRFVRPPVLLLAALLFLAGIDGFLLLEPLKELGSRPFYILAILPAAWLATHSGLRLSIAGLAGLLALVAAATIGYMLSGSTLAPFGEKEPSTQFLAHSFLFLLGFSPLALRIEWQISQREMVDATRLALAAHLAFSALDWMAITTGQPRPFEGIFLAAGESRVFPTGLFSEPSYLAAYVAMTLPVCMLTSSVYLLAGLSAIAGTLFFVGDVRSFFVVYAGSLGTLAVIRWGLGLKTVLATAAVGWLLYETANSLNLLAVEENLSSAYRLGNTISYALHAIAHDVLVGDGFGASHFLYLQLDHPDFMLLSTEYSRMLDGTGQRVPVFNLWIRLAVELGVLPTACLLAFLIRLVFDSKRPAPARVLLAGSLTFTMSTDSYIYGMLTMGIALALLARARANPA
ncbi:MAG: hypothetical protein KBC73_16485 [Burkholderiaceae bacterium]|nr:hypothetical protein [Burkholderiaceae bacterium]